VNDDTSLTVGGDIMFAYTDTKDSNGDGSTSFGDFGSSLVFGGEQAHDNGITTSFYLDFDQFGTFGDIYNQEDEDDTTDEDSSGLATDEYHVSFAGDFGQIKIGNEGDVTGAVFDVADGDENASMIQAGGDSTEVIQYYSNDYNGISFAVQAQVLGDAQETNSSTSFAGYLEADLGMATVGLGYDQKDDSQTEPAAGIVVSTAISGIGLTASFVQDDNPGEEKDITAIAFDYGYGGGSLYGAVNMVDFDEAPTAAETSSGATQDSSLTQYYLGANYSVLPNTYVWAELGSNDFQNDEGDYVGTGLYYGW
jgi:hypothetical protein